MLIRRMISIVAVAAMAGGLAGCGAGTTVFLHDEYNFQFVERVAVIPFDNLASEPGAGARATSIFISELLAAKAFDVVEPGEVTKAMVKFASLKTSELTTEQIMELGKQLKAQGVFFGTVTESAGTRSGSTTINTVSMVVRLVETETGQTIWSATGGAGGRGFWGSLFGTSGKSASEVTRDCVRKLLGTLIH